jgi:hypothetical protein
MMPQTHWREAGRESFARFWAAELTDVPEFTDSEAHIAAGLLLPVWKRLPNESSRVYRLQTRTGVRTGTFQYGPTSIGASSKSPRTR